MFCLYFQTFDKHLTPAQQDTPLILKVKSAIREDLNKRYKNPEEKELLSLVSALDPRVRSLDWMTAEEKAVTYNRMKKETHSKMGTHIKKEPKEAENEPKEAENESPRKKIKLENVSDDDSYDDFSRVVFLKSEAAKEPMEIVEEEIARYITEPSLGLSSDPLQWWRTNQYKYPNLVKLVFYYLHIPGSSVSSECVFSTAGGVLQNREHLSSENVDLLVFLYHNYRKYKGTVLSRWMDIRGF